MADPMKIRANLVGDETEVKVLMSHEMETGQRKDSQGKTIPAWFIQNVKVTHNDKVVLAAQWGPAVAKNPFVSFKDRKSTRLNSSHPSISYAVFCLKKKNITK